MKKYIIAATDVKIVSLGLTIYRDFLLELARRFLSGYNVDYKAKEALHNEVEAVENLLKKVNPESELVLADLDEQTKRLLLDGSTLFADIFKIAKENLFEGVDLREVDYLEKRLKALMESPILLES